MKKTLLFLLCLSLSIWANAIVSKSIDLTTPGTLSTALTTTELTTVTNLTVTGSIDARDFKTMRDNMPSLIIVNLLDSNILSYTGTDGTNGNNNITYAANLIPLNWKPINLTSVQLPISTTAIGGYAFNKCNKLTEISIPSSVITVGVGAFFGCSSLQSVQLSNSVTILADYVFSGCTNLENFVIPTSTTLIGVQSFFGCKKLTSISLPTTLQSIGSSAFSLCSGLTSITIPSSVKSIGIAAFEYCINLTTVTLFEGLTSIGGQAFQGCTKLQSITIPEGVNTIERYLFRECNSLSSITLPNSINVIKEKAFANCTNLKILTLPPFVNTIEGATFYDTGLNTLIIPPSITSLSKLLFGGSDINTIRIPSTITTINESVFWRCSSLMSIYVESPIPNPLNNTTSVFKGVDKINCILYVPYGSKTKYAEAYQWKDFLNIVEMSSTSVKTELEYSINIFPNPVTTSFQINGIVDVAKVTLLDLDGKVLNMQSVSNGEPILISNLPNAVYIVTIATQRGTIYRKIIKL